MSIHQLTDEEYKKLTEKPDETPLLQACIILSETIVLQSSLGDSEAVTFYTHNCILSEPGTKLDDGIQVRVFGGDVRNSPAKNCDNCPVSHLCPFEGKLFSSVDVARNAALKKMNLERRLVEKNLIGRKFVETHTSPTPSPSKPQEEEMLEVLKSMERSLSTLSKKNWSLL